MDAIYGFLGPPEAGIVARMGATLEHRGREAQTIATPLGTLAFRTTFAAETAATTGAGIVRSGIRTLAIAGRILDGPRHEGRAAKTPADILAAFGAQGSDALHALRGAFVLALLDHDTLHLQRDGVGVRTLCWGRFGGRLFFAAEPKAIVAVPGFPRRLSAPALAQYLTFSFVPGEGTMLRDVMEMQAGHRVVAHTPDRDPTRVRWFRPEETTDADPDEGELVERCRALVADAVAARLPPDRDEEVGLFLSGGLDSSIVAAELARQHGRPPHTWAIHFGSKYPHELGFAREAADRTGTRHEEVLVRPGTFVPRLRKIIWHLDDPIGDPITVPNFELSQHAARSVKWIWNGEGGDPLFGGPKNIPMLLSHWYGGVDDGPGFRERAYLASYRRAYDEVGRLLSPELRDQIDPERDLEAVLTPFFEAPRPTTFLHKLLAINLRLKGAHLILPKVERMTAAAGLAAQAPLFDERLAELVFAMPGRMLLRGGIEKWVLKAAYADALPASIVQRPKSGMRVPVHFWFRGELRRFARRALGRRRLLRAGVFDPRRVASLLAYEPTEGGPTRHGLKLWMLVTFEIWRQLVIEGQSP